MLLMAEVLTLQAQDFAVRRGLCTPGAGDNGAVTRASQRRLPVVNKDWDASKTYKQMVILVSYSDLDFVDDDPQAKYHKMLNEPGYNEGDGPGSMADYFREQSAGLFNLQCDVYGPYKVSSKAQPYDNPTENTTNYATGPMREATQMMIKANPALDYKQYDWDGDGYVNQVIYVFAGYCGNQGDAACYGYMWPNTSSFSAIKTPDGTVISSYSASAELWLGNKSCGIGTICHEYTHSLGLPDIYPTGGNSGFYSVCDEWELMDGGNFTNRGWCPPNYSAMEKMLLGWVTPIELTEPVTITGMKAVSEGGECYIIRHTDSEYYLLENRQLSGWDAGLPGRGLLISHVDYDASRWQLNSVNTVKGHFRYDYVHADNLDYEQWDDIQPRNSKQWAGKHWMNNKHLSTSAYPWRTDTTSFVNDLLTDTSVPASVMFNKNSEGTTYLSKAITNITMTPDSLISFNFMGGDPTMVTTVRSVAPEDNQWYNLQGQRVNALRPGIYIRHGKKIIIH